MTPSGALDGSPARLNRQGFSHSAHPETGAFAANAPRRTRPRFAANAPRSMPARFAANASRRMPARSPGTRRCRLKRAESSVLRRAVLRRGAAASAYRRHDQLLATACAPVHLVAILEAQILAHADAHLAQSAGVAADRHGP